MSNSKKELYEFYESIKQGNKCFSAEELDVAIESLKLAQQTLKQSNQSNLQKQKIKQIAIKFLLFIFFILIII